MTSIISKYRTELMGYTMLFVLIGHIITLGGLVGTKLGDILLFVKSFIPVTGFLFLSGYGMMYSLKKNDNTVDFFKRRFFRFWLPFWCLAIPFFLLITVAEHKDIWFFLSSITTVKFWITGNYYGMWYIAITLFLYLITPPVYALVKIFQNVAWFFILVVLLAFVGIGMAIKTSYPEYWENTSIGIARIPYYFMGMLYAYFAQKNYENKKIYFFLAVMILLYVLFVYLGYTVENFHMGAVMLTLGIALMSLLFCLCAKNYISTLLINIPMKWMGKYSYELYLLHLYLWFIIRNTLHLGQWQNIALACMLSLIFAYPVHLVVDWICNKIQTILSK